jgi:hypothetical protein
MPTAFDTDIWFVAVKLRMSILLTSGALRYASGSTWGLKLNNLVLYSDDVVDFFIIACWFKIYIEHVQRVFGLSVPDVCYVPDCVAEVKYVALV